MWCVLQLPLRPNATSSIASALSVARLHQHITHAHPLFAGFPGSASALSAGNHMQQQNPKADKEIQSNSVQP
jgi:hypothetical protein